MQAHTTPVLTDRVPYDWEELKTAAQQVKTGGAPAPVPTQSFEQELAQELVPVILNRVHAQVSILVDMAMKNAAAKIRSDFDQALEKTVQSAVEQVVRERLSR